MGRALAWTVVIFANLMGLMMFALMVASVGDVLGFWSLSEGC